MKLKPYIIYIILLLLTSCNNNREKEGLNIEPHSKDFGNINRGDTVHLVYLIKNLSHDTVKINKINTGCGCTISEYPSLIPPLQIDTLKLIYYSHVDTGQVQKTIVIESDKPPIFQSVIFKGIVQ